jgi:hypothetical protein
MILQIDVGPGIAASRAGQAALMTAVNTARRCFLGGVHVRIEDDPALTEGWGRGSRLTEVITRHLGEVTTKLADEHPTLVIGTPNRATSGTPVLQIACNGWAGGVLEGPHAPADIKQGIALAGVLAAALGVSETFQRACGSTQATRRDVGISLWDPSSDWLTADAAGPELSFLPGALWLLGLGHLGQAYAWCLGLLPYEDPTELTAYLMDTDTLIEGNLATALVSTKDDVWTRKTRVVAAKLEHLGFKTAIVERLFDEHSRPTDTEPKLALAGFDAPEPRRLLGGKRFGRVIDAGLGGGLDYLYLAIHSFPSQLDPAASFVRSRASAASPSDRYGAELDRLLADGVPPVEAQCGVAEIAGISVAAAFVGAIAAALALAAELRTLHEGPELAALTLDLRTPEKVQTLANTVPKPASNLGFARARPAKSEGAS